MFMVEDAITNPTSAIHREPIMWKDLSPVASECLQSRINLLSLPGQGESQPSDSKYNQSCEYPRWSAEQQSHSSVISECSGEGGEERVKGVGEDDTSDASCSR